jgi:ADP-ribose pyrophosphatase
MKLNVISRERLYSGFLKLDRLTIKLPNGKEIKREVIQKRSVIAILAVTQDGEIYLTKQPRAGVNNLESIEIPAGLIEDGEDPEVAAMRELNEETGCVSTKPLISLGTFIGDPACTTGRAHLFLARDVVKANEPHLDGDEYLESFTRSICETYVMLERGEICDANSVIALERARKYLFN